MNLDGPWPDWLPKSPEHILNGVVCWVECCSINSWNGWSASICCCVRSHGCPCDPKWPMFFWTVHRPEWVGRKTIMSLTGNFLYTCFRKRNTWQVVYMCSKRLFSFSISSIFTLVSVKDNSPCVRASGVCVCVICPCFVCFIYISNCINVNLWYLVVHYRYHDVDSYKCL